MSMPMFLAEPGTLDDLVPGAAYVLEGPEGRHAATVKRLRAGEQLMVADGAGRSITGFVVSAAGDRLEMTVGEVTDARTTGPRFTLVQALVKADRDEAAIEAATEIGVDTIIPWQAERSIVQWRGAREEKARAGWAAVLLAASKQSRRVRVPVLEPTLTTRGLARRVEEADAAIVLHEEATDPLASAALPSSGEVLVIVGPEGGLSPGELEQLAAAGGRPTRLGPHVLRSSSAGPAALAVLCSRLRWQA